MPTQEKFIIQGLAGQKILKGSISINGAKNAALKAMAAAILFDGPVILKNIPDTADVETMLSILNKLGAKASWKQEEGSRENGKRRTLEIDPTPIHSTDIDMELATSMRSSVVLTGPMLGRYGKVSLPAPGGCVIGARPIDRFIDGYGKMGAPTDLTDDIYTIQAREGMRGASIAFKQISVGATETLMMAAVLADGKTTLDNCAREPEIVNVAEWLNACGADIKGAGTGTIEIEGRNGRLLSSKKAPYIAIPDRIETGSYLILGALCADDLLIEDCRPDHVALLIEMLGKSGVHIETGNSAEKGGWIRVTNRKGAAPFKAFDVTTKEYPGFATDLQSPIVTFLTQAEGESKVIETIFEGRFKYTEDLKKMGADIAQAGPQEIRIKGPRPLKELANGEELKAHDIRAGFAVVLAALCGTGKFTVNNIHLIDRGYEKLEERLTALGVSIKRAKA